MENDVFEGTLTSQKLIKITGETNLENVEQLVMKIDTRDQIGIGNIGSNVSNL